MSSQDKPLTSLTVIVLSHRVDARLHQALDSAHIATAIQLHTPKLSPDETQTITQLQQKLPQLQHFTDLTGPINDFAAARNAALSEVKTEWVFFLDSDETISPDLAHELPKLLEGKWDGFFIKRKDIFEGKQLNWGEVGSIYLLRLARKPKIRFYRSVHEVAHLTGTPHYVEAPLLHFAHSSIGEFLEKINRYSQIEGELRTKQNLPFRWWQWSYPVLKFLHNYIFRLGILDGRPGFIYAWMMSLHSFLTRVYWYEKKYDKTNV